VISVPHEHTADHDFSGARQIAPGGLGDRLIYELLGFA
jgi:hypothetical protein